MVCGLQLERPNVAILAVIFKTSGWSKVQTNAEDNFKQQKKVKQGFSADIVYGQDGCQSFSI